MKPISIDDLPQHVIDQMSESDRKDMGLMSSTEDAAAREKGMEKQEAKNEAEIQRTVEGYLTQLGYEKRTPSDITRGMPVSGWQIHLYATKRNPILLDLLILSNSGRHLELELKTSGGSLTQEQECLVAYGGSIARSSKEAIRIISEWHNSLK